MAQILKQAGFFIDAKGRSELVVHENLPEALEFNNCHYLKRAVVGVYHVIAMKS